MPISLSLSMSSIAAWRTWLIYRKSKLDECCGAVCVECDSLSSRLSSGHVTPLGGGPHPHRDSDCCKLCVELQAVGIILTVRQYLSSMFLNYFSSFTGIHCRWPLCRQRSSSEMVTDILPVSNERCYFVTATLSLLTNCVSTYCVCRYMALRLPLTIGASTGMMVTVYHFLYLC